jgi:hypothetical protein
MLAELVDHVIGIDPDRDWITAAVLDAKTNGVIATAKFAANNDGYDGAIEWAGIQYDGWRSQLGCGRIRPLRTWPERRAVTCR